MYRIAVLAVVACAWGLPAAAVSVTVDFAARIDVVPVSFDSVERAASPAGASLFPGSSAALAPAPLITLPADPADPSGDVSGSVSFDINEKDEVKNVSGAAPIAGANPELESARVSAVERVKGCEGPCVTIDPVTKPLIPPEQTTARGTLSVEYGPNETFTDPTFDRSVEWLGFSIVIAAPLDGEPTPSSFFKLLQLPGALPITVEYTRIGRGNILLPGVDRDDCAFFSCTTISATVTSGAIRIGQEPAPIPAPPALAALLAALGGFAALGRASRARTAA